MAQYINNSIISSNVLRTIECPTCLEFLEAPIRICIRGHSCCSKCKLSLRSCPLCRSEFAPMRNLTLEKMVTTLRYPCSNSAHGCEVMIQKPLRKQHEVICPFKKFKCKLKLPDGEACTWVGIAENIIQHGKEVHPTQTWMKDDNIDRWVPGNDDELQFAEAYGKTFYVKRGKCRDTIYWGLFLIGPEKDAKDYRLSIEFSLPANRRRRCTLSNVCHPESCMIAGVPKHESRVFARQKFLESFKVIELGIWYKVQIKKLENNQMDDVPPEQIIARP